MEGHGGPGLLQQHAVRRVGRPEEKGLFDVIEQQQQQERKNKGREMNEDFQTSRDGNILNDT